MDVQQGRYVSKRERRAAVEAPLNTQNSNKVEILDRSTLGEVLDDPLLPDAKKRRVAHSRPPMAKAATLAAHDAAVNCVRWRPGDGQLLASGSMDHTVRLWSRQAPQWRCVMVLRHHAEAVREVQWSPDGRSLLTGGFDKTARITDVETGTCTQTFAHREFVTALRYHPHSPALFLSGGFRAGIQCWDSRCAAVVSEYRGMFGQIQDIEFFSDGTKFVSSSDVTKRNSTDKALIVWDLDSTVQVSNQVYLEAFTCPALRLHPHGSHFLAQSNANYIAIFATKPPFKLNKYKRFDGHQVGGYHIQFGCSPDGALVVTGAADGSVFLYDYHSAQVLKVFKQAHSVVCVDAAFHPALPSTVASCSWDGSICILE